MYDSMIRTNCSVNIRMSCSLQPALVTMYKKSPSVFVMIKSSSMPPVRSSMNKLSALFPVPRSRRQKAYWCKLYCYLLWSLCAQSSFGINNYGCNNMIYVNIGATCHRRNFIKISGRANIFNIKVSGGLRSHTTKEGGGLADFWGGLSRPTTPIPTDFRKCYRCEHMFWRFGIYGTLVGRKSFCFSVGTHSVRL